MKTFQAYRKKIFQKATQICPFFLPEEGSKKMRIDKRNKYVNNLYAALHTISGRAEQVCLSAAQNEPIVKTCYLKKQKDNESFYLQLNPNKVVPGSMLKSYSDFNTVLDEAMKRIEATPLQLTRVDLSFNSDSEEDYELFKKLNRLLICCIAHAYNVKNCYKTSDLWTDRSLSVAIKSDTIEAENYNKELESQGQTESKNRLELRSKRMSTTIEDEFLNKWFKRLDKAVEQFTAVQQRYNNELARIWSDDVAKSKKERDFVSLTAFLLRYKDCIFTRKQLENLLKKIQVENPRSKAKKFKDNHKIEFYSLTDLKVVIKAIKDAAIRYFNN